ncbi:uncharacterized protein LOC134528081 [Bacillus rossius redtenbacheri]|uniref:uncharacterized protein LOC134528081 n=1 Tax=Bacillus rossius redtenbacheri TaxID=93214 RepID=UPI002FDE7001
MSAVSSVTLVCATLLLASHIRAGEGLRCYTSSCLKDQGHQESLRCPERDPGISLEECTPDSFSRRWSDVQRQALHNTTHMKCVTLTGTGKLPGVPAGVDVVRMCAPHAQDMCDTLSVLVSTRIARSEVTDLTLRLDCSECDEDGCNSGPGGAGAPLAVAAAAAFAALRWWGL